MQSIIKALPSSAGVYQYYDKNGKILYVGKAKNLKNRVKSYWRFTPIFEPNMALSPRIIKMLLEAKTLEYIIVESEEDALILENSLIKQLKPKYNILLRDDKTYPYICIDESLAFPRFEITRKVISKKHITYYGPFPSGAKILLNALYETYPLVQKKSCADGKKACLFYQIGKCLAPCEQKISQEEYGKIIKKAKESILKKDILIENMSHKMAQLATQERYEEAAKFRDDITTITSLAIYSNLDIAKLQNCDAIALQSQANKSIIVMLFIRDGKVVSSDYQFFNSNDTPQVQEIYTQILLNLYKKTTPDIPNEIIIADTFDELENLSKLLSNIIGKSIKLIHPKSGFKRKIIDLAITNAKELLTQSSRRENRDILHKIQELFALNELPETIEIFDNSHIQGEAAVGAMVSFNSNAWDKNSYRRFTLEAKDEYGQMRELLERRAKEFISLSPPNLWILDGGIAQLHLAREILDTLGIMVDIIAIAKEKIDAKAHRAKGSARDTIYTLHDKFTLLPNDERLQFVQKLRDEAHRFAISFHRQKRDKIALKSKILQKKGVGEATVKKLLNHFGTFEKIEKSSIKEIEAVVGARLATIIKG